MVAPVRSAAELLNLQNFMLFSIKKGREKLPPSVAERWTGAARLEDQKVPSLFPGQVNLVIKINVITINYNLSYKIFISDSFS